MHYLDVRIKDYNVCLLQSRDSSACNCRPADDYALSSVACGVKHALVVNQYISVSDVIHTRR